jgi:hypothetical protein
MIIHLFNLQPPCILTGLRGPSVAVFEDKSKSFRGTTSTSFLSHVIAGGQYDQITAEGQIVVGPEAGGPDDGSFGVYDSAGRGGWRGRNRASLSRAARHGFAETPHAMALLVGRATPAIQAPGIHPTWSVLSHRGGSSLSTRRLGLAPRSMSSLRVRQPSHHRGEKAPSSPAPFAVPCSPTPVPARPHPSLLAHNRFAPGTRLGPSLVLALRPPLHHSRVPTPRGPRSPRSFRVPAIRSPRWPAGLEATPPDPLINYLHSSTIAPSESPPSSLASGFVGSRLRWT